MYEIIKELRQINDYYGLQNVEYEKLEELNPRSYVPIIGRFSVGKSALINSLLQYKRLLKEEITPQPSLPTEIYYTADEKSKPVEVILKDGRKLPYSISDFSNLAIEQTEMDRVCMELNNEFLAACYNLILVDMPGCDVGVDALVNSVSYVNECIAYVIVFSAEDLTLKTTMINILKELRLHKIPVGIVITKTDKVDDAKLEKDSTRLKKLLSRYIEDSKIEFAFTSSYKSDTKQFARYLETLHIKAAARVYSKNYATVKKEASKTLKYLGAINNTFTMSEIEILGKQLKQNYRDALKDMIIRFREFENHTLEMIEDIVEEMALALEGCENILYTMIYNKQNIAEYVNSVIRTIAISSLKSHVAPLIQFYMTRITNAITINVFNTEGFVVNVINKDDYIIELPVLNAAVTSYIKEVCSIKYETKDAIKPKLRKILIDALTDVRYQLSNILSIRINELRRWFNQSLCDDYDLYEKALEYLKDYTDAEDTIDNDERRILLAKHLQKIKKIINE